MQQGGKLDTSHITIGLARIQQLINDCMEVLDPVYRDEMDITEAQKVLIDDNATLIESRVKKLSKDCKQLAKNAPDFKRSHLYKITRRVIDVYFELYKELYENHAALYDVDMGIDEPVRKFHALMNSLGFVSAVPASL